MAAQNLETGEVGEHVTALSFSLLTALSPLKAKIKVAVADAGVRVRVRGPSTFDLYLRRRLVPNTLLESIYHLHSRRRTALHRRNALEWELPARATGGRAGIPASWGRSFRQYRVQVQVGCGLLVENLQCHVRLALLLWLSIGFNDSWRFSMTVSLVCVIFRVLICFSYEVVAGFSLKPWTLDLCTTIDVFVTKLFYSSGSRGIGNSSLRLALSARQDNQDPSSPK